MATTTLELFWNLSSSAKKERIDASVKLVTILEHFQSQFATQTISSDEEDQDDAGDALEALNAQDVSYSIRRLVRGLASPRESSRLGFSVALTEMLSRLKTVTCSQILSLIFDFSKTQGSMTGQEERDMLFARLFGLSSVIQSGLLVRDAPLPSSSMVGSSLSSYTRVIDGLLELGEKKSWLRESAWWTISLAVDVLSESGVSWKDDALNATVDALYKDTTSWTPEKVALTLKLQSLRPKLAWNALLSPTFKHPDLLDTKNLGTLAKILKESYSVGDDETGTGAATQTGSWKPQVHFVWDVLLDLLLPGPNSSHTSKGSIREFWRLVVDESLFSSTSSPERKYWGFQVFQKALPRVNQTADLPMLFTKNFMRSWINHLSNSDRYLHKAARAVAVDMQAVVQKNPTIGFTLILQLTGVNGSRQFDKLTKTRTIESILLSMNAEGITNYIDYLLQQFHEDDSSDIEAISSKRSWIISQLGSLIKHGSIPKTDQWIQTILDWFVTHGLFVLVKENKKSSSVAMHRIPKPVLSEGLRKECRTKLLSSLADLTTQSMAVKSDDDKTTKISGVSSTGEFWISRVFTTIHELEKTPKNVNFLYPLEDVDEEGTNLMEKVLEVVEQLKNVKSDGKEAARGAELLLSAAALHRICFNGDDDDDWDDDGSSVDDLSLCIQGASRLFTPTDKKGHKNRTLEDSASKTEDEPIDLLVDTLIGFLEKPNSYMKAVAVQAFALLSGCVKESTVSLILTQLERRNPSHEGGDEEETEDQEDQSDNSESEESTSSSEDEDKDKEDSVDEAPDLELRKKIEEALRVHGIEAAVSDADDSDEDEEELMDDDQMMAIDEHLTEAFRSRAIEKTGGKDTNAQRDATHFKNRVLDLIEIFVKKQPTSPHIVRFILPIVELVTSAGPDEKQLSDKATGILRSRIGKLKELPSNVKPDDVTTVLQELHTKARRSRSSDDLTTFSQCSMYLVRTLLHAGSNSGLVLQIYRQSLEDFITRKASRLNYAFFQELISRHPELVWNLRDDLLAFADPEKAVNSYRQCQAYQLIGALLIRLPLKDDHRQQISVYMPKLQTALTSLVSAACSESSSITALQLKEILKVGLTSIRQTKRLLPDASEVSAIWNSSTWKKIHSQLVGSARFGKSTGLHGICRQILDLVSSESGTKGRPDEKKHSKEESEQVVVEKRKRNLSEAAGVFLDQTEPSKKKVKWKKNKAS